jgi:hypothetical protein
LGVVICDGRAKNQQHGACHANQAGYFRHSVSSIIHDLDKGLLTASSGKHFYIASFKHILCHIIIGLIEKEYVFR